LAAGRFGITNINRMGGQPGQDPTVNTNWIAYANWQTTAGGWCDPTAAPTLYSGGVWSLPAFSTAPPAQAPNWNPFYPGANTVRTLTNDSTLVTPKVTSIRNDPDFTAWTGGSPQPPGGSLDPYWGASDIAATSHTAGLVTAGVELNSNRTRFIQGQTNFRR